jgi:hypothetical protein
MGLESGTYISDLVIENPVGATDERRFGDDHLRLIKSVLKTTLPDGNQPLRFLRYENRTADAILVAADKAKFITVSSVFNQSFSSPAVLGNGWWCIYRNVATTPHFLLASVNGLGSPFRLYPGEEVMLVSTGFDILGFGLNDRVLMETQTALGGATAEFVALAENRFEGYDLEWENLRPSVSGTELWLQTTINNGAAWITSGTYAWSKIVGDGVSAAAVASYTDTRLTLNISNMNTGYTHGRAFIKFSPAGLVRWETENTPNASVHAITSGFGYVNGGSNGLRLLFSNGIIQAGVGGVVRLYGKRART